MSYMTKIRDPETDSLLTSQNALLGFACLSNDRFWPKADCHIGGFLAL